MKDLKGRKRTFYLAQLIAEGEHEHQDFKYTISDARKIARSISAFANNSGGHLLIGVKDNGTVAGVKNEEDIYMVEHAAQSLCVPAQPLDVEALIYEGGLRVFKINILEAATKPVKVKELTGLKAYYRVKDENIAVSPLVTRAWKERYQGLIAKPVTFNPAEKGLLELLYGKESIDVDSYILKAHVSRQLGEETVVNLYAMGVVDFIIGQGKEMVTLK